MAVVAVAHSDVSVILMVALPVLTRLAREAFLALPQYLEISDGLLGIAEGEQQRRSGVLCCGLLSLSFGGALSSCAYALFCTLKHACSTRQPRLLLGRF